MNPGEATGKIRRVLKESGKEMDVEMLDYLGGMVAEVVMKLYNTAATRLFIRCSTICNPHRYSLFFLQLSIEYTLLAPPLQEWINEIVSNSSSLSSDLIYHSFLFILSLLILWTKPRVDIYVSTSIKGDMLYIYMD